MTPERYAPRTCPVCGEGLSVTRLGCGECGTELSGAFASCEFCALTADERAMLRVFLASRGNMKELERHLDVSYPTARARFDALLDKIGIERAPAPAATIDVLAALQRGEIDVDEAMKQLD